MDCGVRSGGVHGPLLHLLLVQNDLEITHHASLANSSLLKSCMWSSHTL